jgi:hypothetical protein
MLNPQDAAKSYCPNGEKYFDKQHALTCTLIPSFPHPTLLMPRGIRKRGEPEPSFEVFLPLFAPRASPLNILSVNLSKQAHFFWGWTRKSQPVRTKDERDTTLMQRCIQRA